MQVLHIFCVCVYNHSHSFLNEGTIGTPSGRSYQQTGLATNKSHNLAIAIQSFLTEGITKLSEKCSWCMEAGLISMRAVINGN